MLMLYSTKQAENILLLLYSNIRVELLSYTIFFVRQVPWSRRGFMQLMEMVQSCSVEGGSSTSPVLVHCVDGASQSGLFCACWVICEKMAVDHQVDIFHTVKALKLKRYHFINTLVRSGR